MKRIFYPQISESTLSVLTFYLSPSNFLIPSARIFRGRDRYGLWM